MSIKRLGLVNPAANTDVTVATVAEPHLASVIVTNKSADTPALVRIWVVPVGATQASQYSFITYDIEVSENNSFETHRFAMNQSDTLRVRCSTANVSVLASGVPQTATPATDSAQTFTNKTISGLTNTITDIGNSSLVNDSITLMGEEIELGETVANLDYFQFDTTATPTAAVGKMSWDDGEGTVSLGLKGGSVNLQLGQENVALCYNGTGSTITNGSVVYISSAQGQRPSIALADADTEGTSSKTFGIVTENIPNGSEGFVATFGIVNGINTSGFTAGQALWLSSTAGQLTNVKPTAPVHAVFVGYCLHVNASSGRIFVNPQNGYELEELHNVLITSPTTGQGLVYDSVTQLWKNQNVDALPSQTGNSGKYLTTNGTTASWGTIDLSSKADLSSPTFTGTPSAPTAAAGTNTTQIATTAYVRTEVSNLVGSAPTTLDTLNELATALGNDPNFATTVTNSLASKAPLASPTFTGTVILPSDTSIGTVSSAELGYLDGVSSSIQTQINTKTSTGKAIAMAIIFGG